jgi:hypothetical protein
MTRSAVFDWKKPPSASPIRVIAESSLHAAILAPNVTRLQLAHVSRACAERIYEAAFAAVDGILGRKS